MLATMAALNRQIAGLEAEMAPLLARTQGASWSRSAGGHGRRGRVRRLRRPHRALGGVVQGVAGGRAGPGPQPVRRQRRQLRDQPGGLGLGRRAILDLAASICRQPGRWQECYRARTITGHKHPKVALAATGNQIGRTLFALMASGPDYDPDHQARRAQRRTAKHQKVGGQAA
jgi:hypothetical protein